MRIAHFVQRYPPALGGSEAYFARLSKHLAATGDEVTVFTSDATDLEAFWDRNARRTTAGRSVEDGVEVRRYPVSFRFKGRRWLFKAISFLPWRTGQALFMGCNPVMPAMWRDAGRPDAPFDVVHASAFPYGWPIACGLRLARARKIPFILTPFLHTGDPEDPSDRTRRNYTRPGLLALARAASRILVQTEPERRVLLDHGIAERNLTLQGLGVNPGECTGGNREAARRAWGVREDEVLVGHLANNSREKGTTDLLEAATRAWARGSRLRVVLAGPEMANFRDFWERYPDTGRVRRLGILDEEQKRDFFAAIDAFALPSRSDSFGLVLLEAWANGVPTIGYRAGGIAGVIRDEEDGLLVRCGDLDGLSAALIRLERDRETRERMGEAGSERTLRDFRWPDKLDLVREVYEVVTANHTRLNVQLTGRPSR
jgi:glycosyltransferase involved in cell wall biosynthesis